MTEYSWDHLKLDDESNTLFMKLLQDNKEELSKTFTDTNNKLNRMIQMAETILIQARKENWQDILTIWSSIGFMLYISLESKSAVQMLSLEMNFDKQRIYIKNICNIIHESIQDLEVLLGRKLSKELIELGMSKEILLELKEEKSKITAFKKEHFADLEKVRNSFGAHRDHNFFEYHNIYHSIDKTSMMKLAFLFDEILNSLGRPMTKIMSLSSSLKTKR